MRILTLLVSLLVLLVGAHGATAQPLSQFTLGDIDLTTPFDTLTPGEAYRYEAVVEVSAGTGSLTNAVFRLLVSPDTPIVSGTATTSQGTITSGSSAGDTLLEVELGTLTAGSPATLAIDVTLADPFPSCNRVFLVQATLLADGISAQRSMDSDGNSGPTDTEVDISTAVGHLISVQEGNPNGLADPGELLSYRVDVEVLGDGTPDELGWRSVSLSNASLVVGSVTVSNPGAGIVSGNTGGDTTVEVLHPSPGNVEQMTIRFDVLADDPLPASATSVTLDGQFTFPCFTPDDSSLSLPVAGAAPDLVVTKDDGGAVADAGSTVVYAITVANVGGDATGVQLRDVVPANTTFNAAVSDSAWICLGSGPGSVCTLPVGAFSGGAPVESFLIGFNVDDPLSAGVSEIVNSVVVRDDGASGADANPANNVASDTTPIAAGTAPDLVVTKTDGGVSANAGGTIVYTLTVANVGSQDASGVVLSDVVPGNTSFSASSSSPGWSCAGGSCTLAVGAVGAGAPVQSFTIAFTVDDPLAAGVTQISNTVTATDDGASGADLNPANNVASETTPIAAGTAPDLVVTKTDGGAIANAGDTIVYTLTVANVGSQGASGVALSDVVPGNTSFSASSSSPGWSCAGGSCVLAVGAMGAGDPVQSFTIAFTVDDPLAAGVTEIANTVTAADDGASGSDLNPANNVASDTTPIAVGTAPDLVVTKDDGGAIADAGETIVYTLTVANVGSQDASGVELSDTVPGNTSFSVGSSSAGWSCAGSSCTLAVGTVGAGDPAQSLTIAFTVDDPLGAGVTQIFNTVTAADNGASGSDLNPANNVASDTTPIAAGTAPDLAVTKTDGGAIANAGETIVYTLTVANVGSQDASGVVLSDTVPAHSGFSAGSSSAGWSCVGGSCTLAAGAVGAGDPAQSFTIAFTVNDPLGAGVTEISNTVTATDDGASGADLNLANNVASDTTPIAAGTAPDLVVTKTDGGAIANAGETIVYTLTVANAGSQDASGVVLSDVVPAHSSFSASSSSAGWSCVGGSCTLAVGAVGAGDPAQSFTIAFTVDDPLATGVMQISNTVTVADNGASGSDLNPTNNVASDTTQIAAGTAPDLVVTKTDGGAIANAGETIVYTMTVANAGSQDASGVELSDVVPANTSFSAGSSSAGWSCVGGSCTLAVGTVGVGDPVQSFTIAFTVDDPLAAGVMQISNTVTVTDDGASGSDLNPANNVASDTTPIAAGTAPDLVVTKTDGGAIANAGETIVYTLTVANVGSQDASGVVLSDVVPGSTSFSAGSSSAGWSCAGGRCTLAVGTVGAGDPAQSFAIAFTVNDPLGAGATEISNTVTAADDGASGSDLNPANNVASDTTPIAASTAPDLVVTKDDGGVSANAGDTISYAVTVANVGSQDALGVVLSDAVPMNTTLSAGSSSAGWGCVGGNCTLLVGAVGAGDPSQSFTISFTVDDPLAAGVSQISNTVAASDDGTGGADLNPADNTATDVTPIDGSGGTGPDLVITKDDGGVSANAGDTIAYTVTVANVGNQDASGVELTDTVPAYTSFSVGSSSPGWSCVGSDCILAVGTVGAGDPAQVFTISFTVDDPLAAGVTQISNTLVANDDGTGGADLNPADNTATDVTPIDGSGGTGPDLVITKDDGGVSANAGDTIAYTVTVANVGNQDASGVELTDTVPADTSFSAGSSSPGWSCVGSDYTLAVGTVAVDDPAQVFTIAFTVDDPLAAGVTEISNTVTTTDDGASGADLNPADNTATDVTPIDGSGGTGPDLVVTKDDSGVSVNVGDTIVYTVTVANVGNQDASGVELTDAVPANTIFAAGSSSPGWSCVGSDCTLAVGTVAVDDPAQVFTIAFTVDDPLAAGVTEISNTVTTTDDGASGADLNPADNTATDVTPIDGSGGTGPDLVITKDDGDVTAVPGDVVVYSLSVWNVGTQHASGVVVEDVVPEHTSFEAAQSEAGWSCREIMAGTVCVLDLGDVEVGADPLSVSFAVRVDDPLAAGISRITNTASVEDDGSGAPEVDPSNNFVTEETPVEVSSEGDALLTAIKTDWVAPESETYGLENAIVIEYLVILRNEGDAAALGIEFFPIPDPHTRYIPGSADSLGTGVSITEITTEPPSFEVRIDRIEPGEERLITYAVSLDTDQANGLAYVECQGRIRGANFDELLTDDPDTPEPDDPTRTYLEGLVDIVEIPVLSTSGSVLLTLALAVFALVFLKRRAPAAVLLLFVMIGAEALWSHPAFAEQEVPETPDCLTGTPAYPVPESRFGTDLWPEGFRPADPAGQPLPAERDSTAYNGFQRPGRSNGLELFYDVEILEGPEGVYLYSAYNAGFQIWDISGAHAGSPQHVSQRDGWDGDFFHFQDPTTEFYFLVWDISPIDPPSSPGATFVALAAEQPVGLSIWDASDKNQPFQLYQDTGKTGIQVATANIDERTYAFFAASNGVHVYDLTRLRESGACWENTNIASTLCGGSGSPVWRGRLGPWPWGRAEYVDALSTQIAGETRHFLAISDGTPASPLGVEIREITDPVGPASVALLEGLDTVVFGVDLFEIFDKIYLSVVTSGALELYDLTSCLLGGTGCVFGSPIFTVPTPLAAQAYVSYSESNGRPLLYKGFHSLCSSPPEVGQPDAEYLLDLSGLATGDPIVDVRGDFYLDQGHTNPQRRIDYWSSYYDQATDGYSAVSPHSGRFHGPYFYRAAQSILDVHFFDPIIPPPLPPEAAFSWLPPQPYTGEPVAFQDDSTGGPSSWIWLFNFGVPGASTDPAPEVAWSVAGPKLVELEVCNAQGCDTQLETVAVESAEPRITQLYAEPSPALASSEVFLITEVLGQPPITYRWTTPTGELAGNPATWQTAGLDPGTYSITLRAENGSGFAVAAVLVDLLSATDLWISTWEAVCPVGCVFNASTAVEFLLAYTGEPTLFSYDWNGDGIVDESSSSPVPEHAYPLNGIYSPHVRIADDDGNSAAATVPVVGIVNGQNPDPPSTPSDLLAELVEGAVELDWVDHASGETGYRVYRRLEGQLFEEIASLPPDSVTFTDSSGIPLVVTYEYQVGCVRWNDISLSNVATVTADLLFADGFESGDLTAWQ